MKKVLLATTAVAGTLLLATPALAQVHVMTGGYLEFTAGFFDDDVSNTTNRDFRTEAEIVVRAEGRADNGLMYSAEIQLQNGTRPHTGGTAQGQGGSASVSVDEAFITLGGSWGRVVLGDADGAHYDLAVFAPTIGYNQIDNNAEMGGANYTDFFVLPVGATTPTFTLSGALAGTRAVDNADSTKVSYFTPKWSGSFGSFQAGFSYAPEFNEGQSVVTIDTATATAPALLGIKTDYKNWWEAAAKYSHDFGNMGLAIGGGLIAASTKETAAGVDVDEDFTAWDLGAQIMFGGFTIGAGYVDNNEFGFADTLKGGSTGWNLGVSYENGPWAVAASWLHDKVSVKDATALVTNTRLRYDAVGPGFTYTVAPGLVVQGDVMFVSAREKDKVALVTAKDRGWVAMVGTRVNF